MALIRRARYILTNLISAPSADGYGVTFSHSWKWVTTLQDVNGAVCYRCKADYRRGDRLVHIAINSEDTLKPEEIYHYRCIPSARWNFGKLAGSLPAWDLPSDESPAENASTSSAASPTI